MRQEREKMTRQHGERGASLVINERSPKHYWAEQGGNRILRNVKKQNASFNRPNQYIFPIKQVPPQTKLQSEKDILSFLNYTLRMKGVHATFDRSPKK